MKNVTQSRVNRWFLFAAILSVASSCQTSHENEIDAKTLSIDSDIYVHTGGPTLFNLPSHVKSTNPVTITVSSQPSNGDLTSLGDGVYSYTPHAAIASDHFEISILKTDGTSSNSSFRLISVENSSADNFCGAVAKDDTFSNFSGATDLDVLSNDLLSKCDGEVRISIFNPDGKYPPYAGTAEVVDGKIRYTPAANFPGYDKFFYQLVYVTAAGEEAPPSYGRVYVTSEPACTLELNDDVVQFDLSKIDNVVVIDETTNDTICKGNNDYSIEIVKYPSKGVLTLVPSARPGDFVANFSYDLSGQNSAFTDSFIYKICVDGTCKQAEVRAIFNGQR